MKYAGIKSALLIGILYNFQALANQGLIPGRVYSDDAGGSYTLTSIEECRDIPISFLEDTEAMSCRSQRAIRSGLEATSIVLSMCSLSGPIPVNAKVSFAIASAAVQLANFVVEHVPCEEADNSYKAAERICSMLQKQGFRCDSKKINYKKEVFQ
ncbi:MAG: hypothetical protein EBR09_14000 [Proteobacteria bacterium]|nr:hypothetical protein [Pseudomonadota bacterium]